jgi:small subunit ribosomal protein S1
MVLEIDEERRRISLGMKQCLANPWEEFAQNHHKGDRVKGVIKSITDFGIFIGLSGNIDGLVHLSDLSWNEPGEQAVRSYQKGQEIEAVVLTIEPDRERIGLGIKQLEQDPLSNYMAANPKGSRVKGIVKEVDARGANVDLGNGVIGYIRAADLKRERVEDARTVLKEGDELEALFIGVDRKNRVVSLSVKAQEIRDEEEAIQDYSRSQPAGRASLGDILKEHIKSGDNS